MIPETLRTIIENFQMCEGQEKLMYLLEFSEQLPDLPDWLVNEHERMGQVHECLSPVFIAAEAHDGRILYHFDIPREAPTVRGYGGILHQGLSGLTAAEIAAVPPEFYLEMGLQQVITGQRLNGMSAILAYMKTLAQEHAEP